MPAKLSNPQIPQQPRGIRWSDDLYLASTSEIDGWRRWQEIVLLLASKLQPTAEEDFSAQLSLFMLGDAKSEDEGGGQL
jgi:hypothetical protein